MLTRKLKRRVEEAAAKRNMPVTDYWVDAIEQKLAYELVSGEASDDVHNGAKKLDSKLLDEIRELREKILEQRGGKPIEIDVLEQLRSERDDELTGMR